MPSNANNALVTRTGLSLVTGVLLGSAALLLTARMSRHPRLTSVALASATYGGALCALTTLSLIKAIRNGPVTIGMEWTTAPVIRKRYRAEIARTVTILATVSTAAGALLGGVSATVVCLRDALVPVRRQRARHLVLHRAILLAATVHVTLFLVDVAARPLLYEEFLSSYRAGQIFQSLLTGSDRPRLVALVFGTTIVSLFVAPLRTPTCLLTWLGLISITSLIVLPACMLPRMVRRSSSRSDTRPNILLIAADSFRADQINSGAAPFLNRLANRSSWFERAYVTIARTMPSWVTLLTGRFPHNHGVRHMFARWSARWVDLGAIPERLARAGYATAVVTDYAGDNFPRARLGFQVIDAPMFTFRQLVRCPLLYHLPALHPLLRWGHSIFPDFLIMPQMAEPTLLTRRALRHIDRIASRPFFLTVFYSNTHFPYATPSPFYRKFSNPSYRGPYRYGKEFAVSGSTESISTEDAAQVRALYRGCVAAIDEAISKLMEGLAARKLHHNTIVVFTSDHGEALYEYERGQGHGDHLFGDEGTHVPLLIYEPGQSGGGRIESVVRDVDLAPTLCELAGVPTPAGMDGHSLVPVMRGKPQPPVTAFAESEIWFADPLPVMPSEWRMAYPEVVDLTEIDWEHNDEIVIRESFEPVVIEAKHRMIRDRRFKLIYAPTRTGVRWILFDTLEDPGELHNVASRYGDVVESLKAKLWEWMLADKHMEHRDGRLVRRTKRDASGVLEKVTNIITD